MSKQLHHNSIEALHLQSPEFLTGHRQAIIHNAVQNLRVHAQAEIVVAEKPADVSVPEQKIQTQAHDSTYSREVEQLKQDTSVDRIMQDVDAIFEGQGNPLYDQETI